MTHDYTIELIDERSSSRERITGSFPDDAWHILTDFSAYAAELGASPLVVAGMNLSVSVKWNRDEGFSYAAILPPDDALAALLHRVRPFLLQDEPTHFPKVLNLLSQFWIHPLLRAFLQQHRDIFLGKAFQRQLQIHSNNVLLNAEDTLKNWLNAFEYHRDQDKREELDALHKILPLDASRPFFVSMIFDKAKAVLSLASVLSVIRSGEGVRINVSNASQSA